ncbi:MAG TPA: hypothetical protein PK299_10165, partial [Anaerolineales bacterium]|nr:hypothetical protein [Anaerolineales bacterium]
SDFRVISTEGRNPARCAEYQRFLTLANITLLAPIRNDKNRYLGGSDFRVISTEGRNPARCAEYPRFLTLANITLLAPIRNDKAVAW